MTNELFESAKPILNQIQQHGYQAYFVGGSVRDYLMQRPIHDIDITTSATPDEIESIFDHTIPIGKEHGTINVVYNHENYEVTTFRAEEEYIDHRRPSDVHFVRDLYEDVQRRDFTINAIAMDTDYQTFDYFNGEDDIKMALSERWDNLLNDLKKMHCAYYEDCVFNHNLISKLKIIHLKLWQIKLKILNIYQLNVLSLS